MRDHRRGAGAGAAAHAGGDEHHVRAGEVIADFVDHLLGGGAADLGLRAGAETFGDLHAHLDDALGLRQRQRLGVGIGDDEIDALQAGGDHVVDGVAAGAADPEHGDPRLQLADVGNFQIDAHGCLLFARTSAVAQRPSAAPPGFAGPPPALDGIVDGLRGSSEALAQPSSDPGDVAAGPCQSVPRLPRFEMFEMRHLRINQQTRRDGEGRALGHFRQAGNAERPADRNRPARYARRAPACR